MGGGSGEHAQNVITGPSAAQVDYDKRARLGSNPLVGGLLNDYGMGKISLQDALSKVRGTGDSMKSWQSGRDAAAQEARAKYQKDFSDFSANSGGDYGLATGEVPNTNPVFGKTEQDYLNEANGQYDAAHARPEEIDENAFMNLLTTSPGSAQTYIQDRLMNDEMTKGLFGKGGLQDQSQGDYSKQSNIAQGKEKLGEDDMGLYGQLSGNIARQFGSQEQGLAQALADRGLAAGPSGVAQQQFSGMYGNKMEQLAGAQRQVAQQRVDNAMQNAQRLGNMSMQLGQLGQGAMSNMYNRNLAGRQQDMSERASAAGQSLAQQQAQQQQLNTQFEQQQATKGPSFGEVLGGIGGGLVGAATGGIGGAFGKSVGSGLGGMLGFKQQGEK
jgi:hypothetical protein